LTTCEVCGRPCPDADAFCGACGHELGRTPGAVVCQSPVESREPVEPAVVNVRVVNSFWDGCAGCVGWVVGLVVIALLVGWIFSC
jgi:hypothetical protein